MPLMAQAEQSKRVVSTVGRDYGDAQTQWWHQVWENQAPGPLTQRRTSRGSFEFMIGLNLPLESKPLMGKTLSKISSHFAFLPCSWKEIARVSKRANLCVSRPSSDPKLSENAHRLIIAIIALG